MDVSTNESTRVAWLNEGGALKEKKENTKNHAKAFFFLLYGEPACIYHDEAGSWWCGVQEST